MILPRPTCSPVPTTNRREYLDTSTSTFPLLPLANSSDHSSFGAISRKISVIAALFVRSSSPLLNEDEIFDDERPSVGADTGRRRGIADDPGSYQ
jgi:hypothetical protein